MTNANDPINYFEYQVASEYGTNENALNLGLTKREYFAAMAMQGLCGVVALSLHDNEEISKFAVNQADALIKELNQTNQS